MLAARGFTSCHHTWTAVCWAEADESAGCVFGCFHGDLNGRRQRLALQLWDDMVFVCSALVMYSSQRFRVKCHLGCDMCLFVRWDSQFHWESLGRRSLLLCLYEAGVTKCSAFKATALWIDMKLWSVINCVCLFVCLPAVHSTAITGTATSRAENWSQQGSGKNYISSNGR